MALDQMSNFLENELLDHAFRNSVYSAPSSSRWIALFTSNTGLETNNQTNEVSGTGYARLEVGGATGRSFIIAASSSTENNEDWTFATPGAGGWGTVVAMAVCDSSSGGQIMVYGDLQVSRTIAQNDSVIFSAGQIKFTFNESPRQISTHLANELLDQIFRNSNYSQPATVYAGLWTADDGLLDNTQTSEVPTANGYARQAVTFAAASGGLIDNTATVTFGPNTTTNWGTVNYVALLDASTAGNVMMFSAIDTPPSVVVNDSVRFITGSLDVLLK